MEQQQVEQLKLQAAVDSLQGVINLLIQDKMNLQAGNYIIRAELAEANNEVAKLKTTIEGYKQDKEDAGVVPDMAGKAAQ